MTNRDTIKSNTGTKTIQTPRPFIGAQELLSISPCSYSGFLAKRGRRERIVERFSLPKIAIFNDIKKWRKRFVVMCQGCLYVYDKESSRRAHQAFSLSLYNKLQKMGSYSNEYTFRLEGLYPGMKEYYFSCPANSDRKKWMAEIKEQMLLANDKESDKRPLSVTSLDDEEDDDVYIYLQEPIFEDQEETNDVDDDSDDYDEIPPEVVQMKNTKKGVPLPPLPNESAKDYSLEAKPIKQTKTVLPKRPNDNKPEQAAQKPKPGWKPQVNKKNEKVLKESDYMFDGNDRDQVQSILTPKPTGTFLVRNSRNDDAKVLVVKAKDGVREYKVFQHGKEISIDRQQYYKSMQDLVIGYKQNNLPKRDITLGHAYSSLDLNNL